MKIVTILSNTKFLVLFAFFLTAISVSTLSLADARQGPTGGRGGGSFYDGASQSESVAALTVRHGSAIDAVSLAFINNTTGAVRLGSRHGGGGGGQTSISLAPNEEIAYVSGYWGIYNNIEVVKRLYIGTNQGHYYTFGTVDASSRYFNYRNPSVSQFSLTGLNGRSGSLVDALGVIWGQR